MSARGGLSRRVVKRLERLEAALGADRKQNVLKIRVTRIGYPDEMIELKLYEPGRRRRDG